MSYPVPFFDGCFFDPAFFDAAPCAQPVAVPAHSGLLMRGMAPVPYNGPTVRRAESARVIAQAAVDAARARFQRINDEDELVLGIAA